MKFTKSMIVCTSTLDYDGHDALDITVKSAWEDEGKLFAPTWEMVQGVKAGTLSWDEFVSAYQALLVARVGQLDLWHALLEREQIVLCCYCKPGTNCHRHLAKRYLEIMCLTHGVDFEDVGEIPWDQAWRS